MAKYRRGRINDEMCKELANAVRLVKDPRVSDAFISVTAADCTADLKYAKIYYSSLMGDKKEVAKSALANLGDAIAYIDGSDMKNTLVEIYKIFGMQVIGGKLPDDEFYYGK